MTSLMCGRKGELGPPTDISLCCKGNHSCLGGGIHWGGGRHDLASKANPAVDLGFPGCIVSFGIGFPDCLDTKIRTDAQVDARNAASGPTTFALLTFPGMAFRETTSAAIQWVWTLIPATPLSNSRVSIVRPLESDH